MSALLKFEQQAYWQECCTCGITFGMLSSWDASLRDNKKTFYCPNGHSQSYIGKSAAEKVREEMQAKVDEANRLAEWERSQAQTARASERRAKAKLKAQTSRIEAGVCPDCNRTFKQLAAHMKSKHPKAAK